MRHMKFDFERLEHEIEADWPVRCNVPQDGGKVQEEIFQVRFRLHPDTELVHMGLGLTAQKESLRKCVVGFGKEETQVFTPELFDRMLNQAFIRYALISAYGDFALGIAAKN